MIVNSLSMLAAYALPERERQALVCRYFLDLSEAETAQVLAWPLGSVKSRTSRALSRLRGLLVPGEQTRVSSGLRQLSEPLGRSALSDYLEVRVVPEDRLEAFASDFMIIDNHDPHRVPPDFSGRLALTTSPASSPLDTSKLPPPSMTS